MPTYEYECKVCKHIFEEFQGIKDEPIRICPMCQGEVRRLIGNGAGILFKGSGFYETDYKRSSASGLSSSDNGAQKKQEPKKESDSSSGKTTDSSKSS